MADYRRHFDDSPRRNDRDWRERPGDEVRSWFSDEDARHRRGHEDRDDQLGTYRTDDRDVHERYRAERYRDEGRSHNSGNGNGVPWMPRERGGYWRHYEGPGYPNFAGRGPKDYQRSDDRIREEICDCMTDDPLLDASEIAIEVQHGVVTLAGSVTSREQKRRAEDVAEAISGVKDVTNQLRVTREPNGHGWASDSSRASGPATSAQPAETSGKGTPCKSSGTSA